MEAILPMVITAVETLIKIAPQLYQTAQDAKPFAVALFKAFTNNNPPSEADRVVIEAAVDSLAARLQMPLSPAKPGDPDYVA